MLKLFNLVQLDLVKEIFGSQRFTKSRSKLYSAIKIKHIFNSDNAHRLLLFGNRTTRPLLSWLVKQLRTAVSLYQTFRPINLFALLKLRKWICHSFNNRRTYIAKDGRRLLSTMG